MSTTNTSDGKPTEEQPRPVSERSVSQVSTFLVFFYILYIISQSNYRLIRANYMRNMCADRIE